MAEQLHRGTGFGLIEFFPYARDEGLLNPGTAKAYAASSRAVLSIDDDWQSTDIRRLDVDAHLNRFTHIRGSETRPAC